MKSMTGYGAGRLDAADYKIQVEAKSVNNRFLEVSVRSPRHLSALEDAVKKQAQARFSRGKIDIFITLEQISAKRPPISIDKGLAIAYYNLLSDLSSSCAIPNSVDIATLAKLPGVIGEEKAETEDFSELINSTVMSALDIAFEQLAEMRQVEGSRLAEDIVFRCNRLKTLSQHIGTFAPKVVLEYQEKLKERVKTLLGEYELDQTKLANEVAFMADKADISEELTRLDSHFLQFGKALELTEPIGRKLDFIVQEMNREVNTIGSKANNLEISSLVIEVKSELEKIREQVQNIE